MCARTNSKKLTYGKVKSFCVLEEITSLRCLLQGRVDHSGHYESRIKQSFFNKVNLERWNYSCCCQHHLKCWRWVWRVPRTASPGAPSRRHSCPPSCRRTSWAGRTADGPPPGRWLWLGREAAFLKENSLKGFANFYENKIWSHMSPHVC